MGKLADRVLEVFPLPLQEDENPTFNRIRNRITRAFVVGIICLSLTQYLISDRINDIILLLEFKRWAASESDLIKLRIQDLDRTNSIYSSSFIITLALFPLLSLSYAVAYLAALRVSWGNFEVFRNVRAGNLAHAGLSILLSVLLIWTLFFHRIGPGYDGPTFKFIFFPPIFYFLSLFSTVLTSAAIIHPIVLVAKLYKLSRGAN